MHFSLDKNADKRLGGFKHAGRTPSKLSFWLHSKAQDHVVAFHRTKRSFKTSSYRCSVTTAQDDKSDLRHRGSSPARLQVAAAWSQHLTQVLRKYCFSQDGLPHLCSAFSHLRRKRVLCVKIPPPPPPPPPLPPPCGKIPPLLWFTARDAWDEIETRTCNDQKQSDPRATCCWISRFNVAPIAPVSA